MIKYLILGGLLAVGPAVSRADELAVAADKSGCHLFNPVPTKLLRELNTDRPDKTESPFTVDAGINLGVTKSADDLNPFIGFSVRF